MAAFMALARVGHFVGFEDVARGVPVSSGGTTMAELVDYLKSQSADVEAISISGHGLLEALRDNPESCAIAWVDKNHWVVVEAASSSAVRYYDYPQWQTAEPKEFNARFSEKAIFVRKAGACAALRNSHWFSMIPLFLSMANAILCVCVFTPLFRERLARQDEKCQ